MKTTKKKTREKAKGTTRVTGRYRGLAAIQPKTAAEVQDFVYQQLHAGTINGAAVFHTDSDGLWWSGRMFNSMKAVDLLAVVRSVEHDLLTLYPELVDRSVKDTDRPGKQR